MEGTTDTCRRRIGIISGHVATTTLSPPAPLHSALVSQETQYDTIIVGGGINGASTADSLSKKGQRVLLLEQFGPEHEEGSSHGDGRIIRFAYPEAIYVQMSKIAYPLWNDIERRSGEKVINITGGLDFGPEDNQTLRELALNFKDNNIPYETLTADEGNKRFPMFHFVPGTKVLYQKDSGTVFASKAVRVLKNLAAKNGATILHHEKVVDVKIENDTSVKVKTENGKIFNAKNIVITAGGWAKQLLSNLQLDVPLTVTQETVYYFEPTDKKTLSQLKQNMPIFITHGSNNFYGLPPIDVPGTKVGWHHSGPAIDVYKGKVTVDAINEETVRKYVTEVFPAFNAKNFKSLHCLYTSTPDHHFIIDRHPKYKNVIVGSACSGHGFKFGPAFGELVTSLVLNEKPAVPLETFSITRFAKPTIKRTGV